MPARGRAIRRSHAAIGSAPRVEQTEGEGFIQGTRRQGGGSGGTVGDASRARLSGGAKPCSILRPRWIHRLVPSCHEARRFLSGSGEDVVSRS